MDRVFTKPLNELDALDILFLKECRSKLFESMDRWEPAHPLVIEGSLRYIDYQLYKYGYKTPNAPATKPTKLTLPLRSSTPIIVTE